MLLMKEQEFNLKKYIVLPDYNRLFKLQKKTLSSIGGFRHHYKLRLLNWLRLKFCLKSTLIQQFPCEFIVWIPVVMTKSIKANPITINLFKIQSFTLKIDRKWPKLTFQSYSWHFKHSYWFYNQLFDLLINFLIENSPKRSKIGQF